MSVRIIIIHHCSEVFILLVNDSWFVHFLLPLLILFIIIMFELIYHGFAVLKLIYLIDFVKFTLYLFDLLLHLHFNGVLISRLLDLILRWLMRVDGDPS